eukprot:scaffold1029_cov364-Pinguiococcus_pyrenoidosus.AAC.7
MSAVHGYRFDEKMRESGEPEPYVTLTFANELGRRDINSALELLKSSLGAPDAATEPLSLATPVTSTFGTSAFASAALAAPAPATADGFGASEEQEAEVLLSEEGARFLVARDADGALAGLVNFRFSLVGEAVGRAEGEPCLYVHHLLVDESVRRKGVATRMIAILEMMASRLSMQKVVIACPKSAKDDIRGFCQQRSYALDGSLTEAARASDPDADQEGEDDLVRLKDTQGGHHSSGIIDLLLLYIYSPTPKTPTTPQTPTTPKRRSIRSSTTTRST